MSKKLILNFALLFSMNCMSYVDTKLMAVLKNKIGPEVSCEFDENKNFNSCIESLCGLAEKNNTYQDLYNGITLNTEAIQSTELEKFKKNISTYLDNTLQGMNLLIKDYNDPAILVNKPIEPELSSSHKILAISYAFSSLDFEKIIKDASISSHHLVITINEDELKKGLGAKASQAPIYKEFLKDTINQVSMYAGNYGWTLTNQSRYPNLSIKEVIKKELDAFNGLMSKLQAEAPKAYNLFKNSAVINQKILDQILREENPSESLQSDFFESVQSTRLLVKYVTQGAPEFNKLKVSSLGNLYSENELRARLDLNRSLALDLKEKNEILTTKLNHCIAIFQKNQLAQPSNSEKEVFMETANRVRETVKKNISEKLSKETASALSTPLDKIYFDFPSTKSESSFLMNEQLDSLIKNQREMEKKYKGEDKSIEPRVLKMAAIHSFINTTRENFASDLINMCDDFEIPNLNDASYDLGSGKILVSWMSIKNPDMGKSVLTHELGHAISTIVRNVRISEHSAHKFMSIRGCLSEGQPSEESTTETLTYLNDRGHSINFNYEVDKYTEEDWADVISAKFGNEDSPNVGCYLINKEKGIYTSNNMTPTDDEDTHSPDLFRLLRIEYLKKKSLPQSCIDSMSADEQKIIMIDCFK